MKRAIILIVAVLLAYSTTIQAQTRTADREPGDGWTAVTQTLDGADKYYMQDGGVIDNGETKDCWFKELESKYVHKGRIYYNVIHLIKYSIKCSDQTIGIRAMAVRDSKGNIINSDDYSDYVVYADVIPESIGSYIFDAICSDGSKQN
jgi:hypothetical protein